MASDEYLSLIATLNQRSFDSYWISWTALLWLMWPVLLCSYDCCSVPKLVLCLGQTKTLYMYMS